MKTFFLLLIGLCFTVLLQAQVSKTADVTAGSLKTVLTTNELNSVTNLTLTGTIDARDFKTMRDDMPVLSVLDLSGVTIAPYYGSEGTTGYETSYPANAVPQYAFCDPNTETEQGKTSLTIVLLPSSVTSIGSYAFLFCNKLVSVMIPASVSSIGYAAFLGCSGLITADANNPNYLSQNGALYNKTQTTLIQCSVSKTGSFAIPSSVTTIGLGAFYNSKLSSVSIPSSVTSISFVAFYNCSTLTSIFVNWSYPLDLNSNENVFSGVNKTTCTLNVPYGAKRFYATALQWKDFISIVEEPTGFILSSNLIKIASEAGSHSSVILSANVAWTASSDQTWLTANPTSGTGNQTISFTAEANSSVLSRSSKITFSATGFASQILSVNQEGMNKTIQVTAGGLLAALTGEELSGISNLTLTGIMDARDFKMLRDTMPNLSVLNLSGVRIAAYNGIEGPSDYFSAYQANAIPAYAFFNSNTQKGKGSLSTVVLPSSLISIDYNAFMGCKGLTSVIIPPMVTTIGYLAFQGCTSLTSLTIPSSVTQIENNALSSGAWISVEASNPNYSSLDGVLFNKDKTSLIQCPTSKTGNYNIPSSVIYIEYGAFVACNSLTNITIPSSVTSVEGSAFNNCTGLISVDANNQNYSGIDGVLFNKNTTTLIKCPISKSGSYVIPSKVTNIDGLAFYYCSLLNSITIPVSVTSIADGAFNYCTGLTSLYANSSYPIKLEQYTYIFEHVNRTTCTLNVPFGAKKLYAAAEQWKDFTNIIEAANGFILSSVFLKLDAADGSSDTINITSNVSWTANSNQTWLTVNPTSGSGNNTFTFIAAKNNSLAARRAFVTVSATGFDSQVVTINQSGTPKTINIEAGGLHSGIPADELSQISNFTITGTMDARDFKFLRDNMPSLAELDLSGVTIAAYSGTEGTSFITDYPANSIPQYAFYNLYNYSHNSNLTTIILPSTITSIGEHAFHYCEGLTSVTIPPSVTSIGNSAFYYCSGLSSIYAKSSYPVDLSSAYSVFSWVDKNTCKLNVPYGSKEFYSAAAQWKDFKTIVEESQGFLVSPTSLKLTADSGSSAIVNITANVTWTAISDQTWLTANPTSGTGDKTLTFTADANTSVITRTAKVTFSATGITSQSITISQNGQPEIIDVTAGALASKLTPDKLNGITNLTVTGTIDARDFKTMHDNMPSLAILDISGATVVAYSGTEGTSYQMDYPANAVPEYAFYSPNTGKGKTSLTSVVLPATLTKIGTIAFQDCSGLNSIIIPSGVSEFGSNAFSGCSSLPSIELPSSLNIVQVGAFNNCKSLTTITIPSSVVLIGNNAFSGCTGLTTVNLPSSLVYIWDYAFSECSGITALDLPTSVKFIGESVFSGCRSLTSIVIPSLVTSIAKNTFQFCINLTSVTIPPSVTSIGEGAFTYCRSLTSVTIPMSVTLIGSSAFTQCTGLASIFANSSHPVNLTSSPGVFSGINKTTCTLNVPYTAGELYSSANQWKDFIKINEATQGFRWDPPIVSFSVEGGNAIVNSTANVVWTTSFDQTWLTVNPASGTGIQTITFTAKENPTVIRRILKVTVSAPDVLSQIITVIQEGRPDTINIEPGGLLSSRTFAERNGITNLTLTGIMDARDFKTIRDEMPLLEVLDLSGVTIVAYSGTEGTSFQMEYPANTIPESAFYYTNTGKGKTGLTAVVLPSSVIAIGNYTFNNCTGLTTLTIPASVNSIGYGAFGYCSGLTSIFANSGVPVDLSSSWAVFDGIDKNSCTLNVPYGSRDKYASAYQWQDFINIIEADSGIRIDPTILNISAIAGSTATATITSNVTWTASCDQSWLTVNPASGSGDQTLSFTAEVNSQNTSRKAIVTISAQGFPSQIVYVTQEPAPLEVTAGNLKTLLSAEDLATRTKLTLIGTIDARDFKTMRDDMPNLKEIDLLGATIVSYSGNGGTAWYITEYPANKFPDLAFYSLDSYSGKQSLISVTIPNTVINIGSYAFQGCNNLPDINIPESVTVIEDGAFMLCSSLTKVNIPSSVNFIGSWAFQFCNNLTLIEVDSNYPVNLTNSENVFNGIDKFSCTLKVPYGSASRYAAANQWKEFTNIVEMPGFILSANTVNLTHREGSSTAIDIKSNVDWTLNCDQSWLTVNPTSGTGDKTLEFIAEANPMDANRTAIVTVSAEGIESQTITVTQNDWPTDLIEIAENSAKFECYPNPFSESVTIEIWNPKRIEIIVDIYNLAGERIKNLASGISDEQIDIIWNVTNDSGQKVAPGVYICKMNNQLKKMIYKGK